MDKIFKVLADKNRRLILTLLRDRSMGVSEMVDKMNVGQATVSAHLAKMKRAGIVEVEVSGKRRIYKIKGDVWNGFIKEINGFSKVVESYQSDEIIVRRKELQSL